MEIYRSFFIFLLFSVLYLNVASRMTGMSKSFSKFVCIRFLTNHNIMANLSFTILLSQLKSLNVIQKIKTIKTYKHRNTNMHSTADSFREAFSSFLFWMEVNKCLRNRHLRKNCQKRYCCMGFQYFSQNNWFLKNMNILSK